MFLLCRTRGFVMSERKEVPREEDVVVGVEDEVRCSSDNNLGDEVGYGGAVSRREDSIASWVKSEARTSGSAERLTDL
ncbi:hypothetical protein NDU88_005412 [Pleurodeles waltl]|uniref:Uncharacterized protein n=1 Tax=Pleurodeles waltl TaxID=8319 RepID=A0AAV7UIN0_PLEWA|nr:hypothetical protein NDU88_005412 [Pleurodeles waltl]